MNTDCLTDRWTKLKKHKTQSQLWRSRARFRVVPAGRRSGKTELAKRFTAIEAFKFSDFPDGWFVLGAPTHAQAKRIYWGDMKRLVPDWLTARVYEAEMTIRLVTGTEISVLGLDEPKRVEGRPLDGIVLDEYADMKPQVWTNHVRPALSTIGRPGWAWFIGVPEGRNHYYQLYKKALKGEDPAWEAFHWVSSDILDPAEIAAARNDLDRLTFEQEYEGSFLNFEGRAYYDFDAATHCAPVKYDPKEPLIFVFDFNVKPGVAGVVQEQKYTGRLKNVDRDNPITMVIDEVYIPNNSNTVKVCHGLVKKYGFHKGPVYCYGDAAGGARKTSNVVGSDWAIVSKVLGAEFPDVRMRYKKANPPERARLNAMNCRIKSVDGKIRLLVNPNTAPKMVEDLEGVTLVEGGSGQIDELANPMLCHLTDGLGYYVEKVFPTSGLGRSVSEEY